MARPGVLNVRQCGMDQGSIHRYLERHFEADAQAADTRDEVVAELRTNPCDLVLVNRVGDWDGAPGLALIQAMKTDSALAGVPVMLVCNFPEARAEAMTLGALPGFGKADLRQGSRSTRSARRSPRRTEPTVNPSRSYARARP